MTNYNTIESYASDASEAARSALNQIESLESLITSGELEEALEFKAQYDEYFDESPADVYVQVEAAEEWAREFPYDEPYQIREAMDELEEYRDLGDLEDVRTAVEDREDDTNVADLKARNERLEYEIERQAKLIAKLASALDDIDTIVGAELAGTGGQV